MLYRAICTLLIGSILLLANVSAESRTAAPALPKGGRPTIASEAATPVLPGFTDALVTSVTQPATVAFTPDGRMLIAGKLGRLYVYQNGALVNTPALNLDGLICNNRERGLLGLAVDPDFADNHYVYLYYTFKKFGACPAYDPTLPDLPVNRVSRFTLNGNTISKSSEFVVVDNIPSPTGSHNAGDIHFGADGLLYISTGDGACKLADATMCSNQNDNALLLDQLAGKILRVRRDGSIPDSNPYKDEVGSWRCGATIPEVGTGPCQEIVAHGLRNPFRFTFKPGTNTFYINDVGNARWEEIDVGAIGANYGWSVREGHCSSSSSGGCGAPPAGMTNPIYDYGHTGPCTSITGGVFVPVGMWPDEYDGAYLFGDYACGTIYRLEPTSGGGYTASTFITDLGVNSLLSMVIGPYEDGQAIYYTTFLGEVRRITYTGQANRAPTAAASASPVSGPAPLRVEFDGSDSSDPDDDELTYDWDFGDGTDGSSREEPSHTYQSGGVYTATLVVRDEHDAVSDPVTIRIDVDNSPPEPQIVAQAPNAGFKVGQTIVLQGSATDPQDGVLDGSRLTWTVLLHHNEHTHPYVSPTEGATLEVIAPEPEDLDAAQNSYLEVQLVATDSQGLTTMVTRNLMPHKVDVTLATQPSGLRLVVNENEITAPRKFSSWEGYALNVTAPEEQADDVGQWTFKAWLDGGGATRKIVTPPDATTFTATYEKVEINKPTFTILMPLVKT